MSATHSTDSVAMTAAEFRVATESLGIDQRAAARILGVSERTVRRWIAGSAQVPPGVGAECRQWAERTASFVGSLVAIMHQGGPESAEQDGETWVATYASDAAYRLHHPDSEMPAAWHRAAMARVWAEVPWVRLHYIGPEDPE